MPGSRFSYDSPMMRTSKTSLSRNPRITAMPGPGLSILFRPVMPMVTLRFCDFFMVGEVKLVKDIHEIIEVFFRCGSVGEVPLHEPIQNLGLGLAFLEPSEDLTARVIGAVRIPASRVKDESAFADGDIFLDLHLAVDLAF